MNIKDGSNEGALGVPEDEPKLPNWEKIYRAIREAFPSTSLSQDELLELSQSEKYKFGIAGDGKIYIEPDSEDEPPVELFLAYALLMFLQGYRIKGKQPHRELHFRNESQDIECDVSQESIIISSASKIDDNEPVVIKWNSLT